MGVDLDGVLFDFAHSLHRYLVSIGHEVPEYDVVKEVDKWEFYEDWQLSVTDFLKHCHDGVDAGYVFRGPVRPGSKEALDRIKAAGHEIHIVTDRSFGSKPYNSERATYDWLEEHGLPFNSVTFSPDKTVVPTDCFVEDKIANYDALKLSGVDAYLITRPWNKIPSWLEKPFPRKRLNDIRDYAGIIEAGMIGVF